jgi:hypothetical protein
MSRKVAISGGAGPQETAAILAAVARVLQDEAAALAAPPAPPRQSPWVSAWRPRDLLAPASGNHEPADWWSETFPTG